jgi:hypothetical protein
MRNAMSTCAHCGIVRVHITLFFQCLIRLVLLYGIGSETWFQRGGEPNARIWEEDSPNDMRPENRKWCLQEKVWQPKGPKCHEDKQIALRWSHDQKTRRSTTKISIQSQTHTVHKNLLSSFYPSNQGRSVTSGKIKWVNQPVFAKSHFACHALINAGLSNSGNRSKIMVCQRWCLSMPPVVPDHRPVHFPPVLREMESTSIIF